MAAYILPNAFAVPDDDEEVVPLTKGSALQLLALTATTQQQVSVSVSGKRQGLHRGTAERPDWRANGQIAAADDGDALAPFSLPVRPSSVLAYIALLARPPPPLFLNPRARAVLHYDSL